jgi:dienelactone hydrolase
MPITTKDVQYDVAGRKFTGFLADGSAGRQVPGVLVAHEGRGFTQHPKDRARMLAELGFVAFAPDYFGEPAKSLEHAYALMSPYTKDPKQLTVHGLAALQILFTHPNVDASRMGAIGFCWGGYAVFELACAANLQCVVGFHPGLSLGPLSRAEDIAAKFLVCVGEQDLHVPMPDIQRFMAEMRRAKVDTQVLLLAGAPHSFTNPEPYPYPVEGVGYDAVADRRAWQAMRALFEECLGQNTA